MIYYHFTGAKLRDGKEIPAIGEWLVFDGEPVPCECGLHASPDAFDALQYAPGETLHQVELDGVILPHGAPVDRGPVHAVWCTCPLCTDWRDRNRNERPFLAGMLIDTATGATLASTVEEAKSKLEDGL